MGDLFRQKHLHLVIRGLEATILVGIALGNIRVSISPIELRWLLDRVQLAFFAIMYLIGGMVLAFEHRRSDPWSHPDLL